MFYLPVLGMWSFVLDIDDKHWFISDPAMISKAASKYLNFEATELWSTSKDLNKYYQNLYKCKTFQAAFIITHTTV